MTVRPDRYRNAIVPHIYVEGASDAIAFYERAFGAEELLRIAGPDGKILHAEISICNSVLMIGDPRLVDKPYGKTLWRSLPPMRRTREQADVEAFFRAA